MTDFYQKVVDGGTGAHLCAPVIGYACSICGRHFETRPIAQLFLVKARGLLRRHEDIRSGLSVRPPATIDLIDSLADLVSLFDREEP
jgi:hypothetical protein